MVQDERAGETRTSWSTAPPDAADTAGHSMQNPWGHVLRRVAWEELFPWLLLFRSFRLALSPTLILLGAIGVLVAPIGWNVADLLFIDEAMVELDPSLAAATSRYGTFATELDLGEGDRNNVAQWLPWNSQGTFRDLTGDYAEPLWQALRLLPTPQAAGDEPQPTAFGLRRFAYFSFGTAWLLMTWSLVAGAITRIVVVRLTRDERVDLVAACKFSVRHYLGYVGAPLLPLSVLLLFMLIMFLPGWLMWMSDGTALLMTLLWGLFLLLGLGVGLLLVVLSVAWPLMAPAVSSEGGDAFDAVSRTYAYVYQRPLQYLAYAIVVVFLLAVGGLIGAAVAGTVTQVTLWSASWGAGSDRMLELLQPPVEAAAVGSEDGEENAMLLNSSRAVLAFWNGLVAVFRAGFLHGLFWCLATATYLLLRRSVDETELDEVHFDDQQDLDELPELEQPPHMPDSANSETADSSSEPETPQLVEDEPQPPSEATANAGDSPSATDASHPADTETPADTENPADTETPADTENPADESPPEDKPDR